MRALSIGAVVIGAVTGILVTALVSAAGWALLLPTGIDRPQDPALMIGVIAGFVAAGYAAGRMEQPSPTHGMLSGLVTALIVGAVGIASGSPATTQTMAILVVLAGAIGRLGGLLAGRRRGTAAGDEPL